MNCAAFDWKAYLLAENSGGEKSLFEDHLAACRVCREELDRLRLTHTALLALRDEEIPQRIAFVSDKVFEPAWWQRLWHSGPAMGFASALVLAAAIVVHATGTRPSVIAPPSPAPVIAKVDEAAIEKRVAEQVARRMEAAVHMAVAASEERQKAETAKLLQAAGKRFDFERRADQLAASENMNVLRKQLNLFYASSQFGARQ